MLRKIPAALVVVRRLLVLLGSCAAALSAAAQQYRIEHSIAMPDVASHLYAITLVVSGLTGRVFADAPMSGTFSVLDSAHANWNGGSLFLYVDGHKQDPVSLSVDAPQSWTIVNGDVSHSPGSGSSTFRIMIS